MYTLPEDLFVRNVLHRWLHPALVVASVLLEGVAVLILTRHAHIYVSAYGILFSHSIIKILMRVNAEYV